MHLVRFARSGLPATGCLLSEDSLLDFTHGATGLPQPADPLGWFDLDGEVLAAARALVDALLTDPKRRESLREAGAIVDHSKTQALAPIARPGKFLCIGLNYRDHAEESGMAVPDEPVVFSKCSNAVTAPDSEVPLPRTSDCVDYEAELAIVIGRRVKRVDRAAARDAILGYTCVNDVSARDLQAADPRWVRAKSLDGFGPLGPAVVTADEIHDPHALGIRLRLNGETMQDSTTAQLIFGVDELVSFLSQDITLEPGDVISTGTPPGVGFARKPPVYLKDGDVMEVEIDGLGVLRNTVRG